MQELDFGYYDRNRTGALMSRLTSELFEITELAHHGPEDIFISGVTVIGALVIMFTIQWRLALVIAAILPVFLIVVWTCRRSMSQASRHVKQKTAAINAGIESGISGIRTQRPSPTRRRNWRSSMSPMTFIKPPRRNFIRRWADSTA